MRDVLNILNDALISNTSARMHLQNYALRADKLRCCRHLYRNQVKHDSENISTV